MEEDLQKLGDIGLIVIKEEGLPIPTSIKFADTFLGTRKRKGCCIRNKTDDTFKIRVNIRTARFTECATGKYTCRKTGNSMTRVMGKRLDFGEIKHTLAHEIAHLKFWNHDAQHISYTNHILNKINKFIREHNDM